MTTIEAPPVASPPASVEDDEPTAEERIENAVQAASETQPSWKMRCYRILGALGKDFGDNDDPDDFAEALLSDRAAMAERVAGLEHVTEAQASELRRMDAAVRASEAEVARLREALEPFAKLADDDPDPTRTKRMAFLPITQLRAARAALTRPDEPTKET